MMKILVTGGTGYIGSHTIVALQEAGFEVISLDNLSNSEESVVLRISQITGAQHEFVHADVRDFNWMYQALHQLGPIAAVIHFAALKSVNESVEKPLLYFDNNITGTINVLKLMQSLKIPRLVFSSSCTVYGQPDELPVSESSPFLPAQSPYGYTKQVCESVIRDAIPSMNPSSAISLRYFNPVGAHPSALIGELPRGIPNNLAPFITQTAIGLRPVLKVYGDDYNTADGTCIRDYIHVMDLADAHVAALRRLLASPGNIYEVFNIGTGKGASVLEVIHAFEQATGIKLNYEIARRRPGDIEQIWANTDLAKTELNWSAKRSLKEAMENAWKWQSSLASS